MSIPKVKNQVNISLDNLLTVFEEEDLDYLDKDCKKRKEIEEKGLEKCMAYLSIVKATNNIYKDLKENMKQQHSFGTKQYLECLQRQ